jgi:hypothetical protein
VVSYCIGCQILLETLFPYNDRGLYRRFGEVAFKDRSRLRNFREFLPNLPEIPDEPRRFVGQMNQLT